MYMYMYIIFNVHLKIVLIVVKVYFTLCLFVSMKILHLFCILMFPYFFL